jgi:cytochrome c-type biogenesis protein CcsB
MGPAEGVLFWIALALYSIGWLLLILGPVFKKERAARIGYRLLVVALVAHTACILTRWVVTGHGPVMRNFENALAGSWVIACVSVYLASRREPYRLLCMAAIPVVMLLLGYGLTQAADREPLSPALRTPWLYIHVTFAWISFGTFTAASCAAAVFLIKSRRTKSAGDLDDPQSPARTLVSLDELQFRLVAYGFVSAAVMIASGAIWARLLWGTYWGWDPVETWSLASWIVYGLYIHLRLIFGWHMQRAAWLALFAVIPVIVSFWGVGLMMNSRHLFEVMDMVTH